MDRWKTLLPPAKLSMLQQNLYWDYLSIKITDLSMKTLNYCAVVLWQQDRHKKHQKKISFLKVKAGLCSHLPHYYITTVLIPLSNPFYKASMSCTRSSAQGLTPLCISLEIRGLKNGKHRLGSSHRPECLCSLSIEILGSVLCWHRRVNSAKLHGTE